MKADDDVRFLISLGLAVAVPLRVAYLSDLRRAGQPELYERRIRQWATDGANAVAHRGDHLMYGGRPGNTTADVFNALARGVAALATLPGGVRVFGVLFCATHVPYGTTKGDGPCPDCGPAEAPQVGPLRTLTETIKGEMS
jgi:hypothetical protein